MSHACKILRKVPGISKHYVGVGSGDCWIINKWKTSFHWLHREKGKEKHKQKIKTNVFMYIYLKKTKILFQKKYMYPDVPNSIICHSQDLETIQVPING